MLIGKIKQNEMPDLSAAEQHTWNMLTWMGNVDKDSLELENVRGYDHPDYCDAYLSYGELYDGTKLTEEQLEMYQDEYPDVVYELCYD